MTMKDKQTKALYMAAWDDLNRIANDVRIADDAGDIDTVRNGLCAASIFMDELTPYVKRTAIDDMHRVEVLHAMHLASEAGSPSSMLKHIDGLLNTLALKHDVFPQSLEEDESIHNEVRELSTKSAGSCRYIRVWTPHANDTV